MKRILGLCVLLVLAVSANAFINVGGSLGVAQYVNPTVVTTLSTAPTSGVTIPANTKTIIVTVEGAPIRYFFGATNPTGTIGSKLAIGTWVLDNNPRLIANMKFINDSSGAATVTVEYLGQ